MDGTHFGVALATNLHELGIADLVIQGILRHSTVEVTRQAYIKHNAVDARSLAAMKVLERQLCNKLGICATASCCKLIDNKPLVSRRRDV